MNKFQFTGDRACIKDYVFIDTIDTLSNTGLFYTGRFDFVVYENFGRGEQLPILAIELDGKEHYTEEAVRERDREKNAICEMHGFSLIRVDNTYARRYHYIKQILFDYFDPDRRSGKR
ncbi:MAG: DUF2726 domain-containing protein [Ruminococcaceae bacterium]|nr:DUF2726 domain-containing protein [Oscillospiraceae bacterium]